MAGLKVKVVIQRKHAEMPAFVVIPAAKVAPWKLSNTTTVEGTLDGVPLGRRSLHRWDERRWFIELRNGLLEAIDKSPGDHARLVLHLASAELPAELQDLIDSYSSARACWEGRTDAQRRMLREHILSAKTSATHERRARRADLGSFNTNHLESNAMSPWAICLVERQWRDTAQKAVAPDRNETKPIALVAMLLRLAAAPLLLTACTATPASTRVVVLESESYGCGAAEGLGCGLAIAPVLHAIDELDGVAESSVSWDGRYFRIEVLSGADPDRVFAAAAAILEGESCCVTAPRGKAKPAVPDQWFNSEQTLSLSRHEAEVIASNFTSEITVEVALAAEAAERLHGVLRQELERAFERAHAAGGGVHRLWDQLPTARAEFESRLSFLTPEQQAMVSAVLDRKFDEE